MQSRCERQPDGGWQDEGDGRIVAGPLEDPYYKKATRESQKSARNTFKNLSDSRTARVVGALGPGLLRGGLEGPQRAPQNQGGGALQRYLSPLPSQASLNSRHSLQCNLARSSKMGLW